MYQQPKIADPVTETAYAEVDRAIEELRHGRPQELVPPAYGSPTRQAVNSLIESLVTNLCEKIGGCAANSTASSRPR